MLWARIMIQSSLKITPRPKNQKRKLKKSNPVFVTSVNVRFLGTRKEFEELEQAFQKSNIDILAERRREDNSITRAEV